MEKIGATIWARKTLESDVFYWKPDKWFKIWFYIVNRVNFEDTKLFPRGECFITYKEIMDGVRATKHQVDQFIRWSKKESMLTTRKTTRGMIVKVLKYDKYQTLDNYKNDNKNETKTKQKRNINDTISKYVKNDKNVKKSVEQSSPVVKHSLKDLELATLLQELILNNTPTFKLQNLDKWADHVRLMREQDNRTEEQIEALINWSQQDGFWKANILSTKKLREKFDQLVAQAKRDYKGEESKGRGLA